MTAEPVRQLTWSIDPTKQRRGGYTIEDLLNMPEDAPRMELSDGVVDVVPSPTGGHQKINSRLVNWLDLHLPAGFESLMAVGVVLDGNSTREPDAVVLHSPVEYDHHYYLPEQVLVAIEIVSPNTRKRDRFDKPGLYAAAGIPHYWRIEQNPVHIFAYDLVDGRYEPAADSAEELVLSKPFEIKLPIRDITP
jgi:Uma2 family endonuclease